MMGYGRGYGYGYGSMMNGGFFGPVLMFLFVALFVVGVVLLVIWAIRASAGHGHGPRRIVAPPQSAAGHDEAVAIAKRRFASGEIMKEQYDEIMGALGG